MTQRQEVGKLGEDLAVKYLKDGGYKIIERNHWKPWGELDIITTALDKTLVFFEVKSLKHNLTKESSSDLIQPENNLTQAKLKKLQRTASLYVNSNSELVNENRGWRIDLLAIDIFDKEKSNIRHYENI